MLQLPIEDEGLRIDLEKFSISLSWQLETLGLRVQLTERTHIARVAIAMRMLMDGRYSQNAGLKSALLDILRRYNGACCPLGLVEKKAE